MYWAVGASRGRLCDSSVFLSSKLTYVYAEAKVGHVYVVLGEDREPAEKKNPGVNKWRNVNKNSICMGHLITKH